MRHVLTLLVFAAAAAAYMAGSQMGTIALFLLGGALETYGWSRIIRARRQARASAS